MYFVDYRWRRLAEDLIFPSPKEGMNPRSFAFLKMALRSKKHSVLFATFPKCGWNWTGDILEYCLTRKFTGKFDVEYRESGTLKERMKKPIKVFTPADSRSRNRQKVNEQFPDSGITIDYCFHTHGHWKYSPFWGLDEAKTIFIVRDIPTSLFSYYKSKLQLKNYDNFEAFLNDGNLDRAILYYNTWGTFSELPYVNFKVFKYEDMRKDPAANFCAMYNYAFDQEIEQEIMTEALDFFSFENQKKREFMFEKDETKHFHFKGKTNYKDEIEPDVLEKIYQRLNNELKYKFDYEYKM